MAKIFLFRHGETTDNKDKIFSGWRDVDLTDSGIAEAKKIGEELKNEPVTKSYCSDEIRSKHTLDLVLHPWHHNVPIIVDPRLRERDYGKLTGLSKTEMEQKDPENYKKYHRSYDGRPPGGESIADVEKRVMPFLQEMLKHAKPDDVIFISAHGNSLRPIRKYFEHMSNEEMASFEHAPGKVYRYRV